jgi:uncharacterized protein YcfL
MKYLGIVVIATLCIGCSSNQQKTDSQSASNSDLVCEYTMKTGSHIKKKRCISRQQAEIERSMAESFIRDQGMDTGSTADSSQGL